MPQKRRERGLVKSVYKKALWRGVWTPGRFQISSAGKIRAAARIGVTGWGRDAVMELQGLMSAKKGAPDRVPEHSYRAAVGIGAVSGAYRAAGVLADRQAQA